MPDHPTADYWKRAFLAACRWPYDPLGDDLRRGKLVDRIDTYSDEYVTDFNIIKAALDKAKESASG